MKNENKGLSQPAEGEKKRLVTEYLINGRWVRDAWFKNLIEATRAVEVTQPEEGGAAPQDWKGEDVRPIIQAMGEAGELDDKFWPKPSLTFYYAFRMGRRSLHPQLQQAESRIKELHTQRKQIWELLWDKEPFCRDCADENGTCPSTNEPCDPHERAVFKIKTLQQQLKEKS
jgi:hypothetical protein